MVAALAPPAQTSGARRSPGRLAAAAAAVCVVLVLIAWGGPGGSTTTSSVEISRVVVTTAPGPSGPMCDWTPFSLPMEAQRAALDLARLQVPSYVKEYRRLLTVQLAMGALQGGVEGDFVETGVARGGTAILLLKTLGLQDKSGKRKLWAADSFQGLPEPVEQDKQGALLQGEAGQFRSSLDEFKANLQQHGVLEPAKRLQILQGWFNETLPPAPIKRIAYLRLDGDLYVSTKDALDALYDRVSPGGLIYVDDYGSFTGCKRAVDEFRQQRGVTAPLMVQALPEGGFAANGTTARWEAAWWIKGC